MRRVLLLIVPTVLLAGCVSLRAIPEPIPAIDFIGSADFIIFQPYRYRIGSTNEAIEIPAGFVTDYASIPSAVRWILPKQSSYSRTAVIHDYLYWSQICTKQQADNILFIAMKELKVPKAKRWAIHKAVSVAGGGAWSANRAERLAGKPKVVPTNQFDLATSNTWPQAREILIRQGVHDPAFATSPAACALGDGQQIP